VSVGDVENLAPGAQGHAAGVQADGDGLHLLPFTILAAEDGDGALVGDAGARIDAEGRAGRGFLWVAGLRRVAAPVADIGAVGPGNHDRVRGDADRDHLLNLATLGIHALDTVAARRRDEQFIGRQPSDAGGVGGLAVHWFFERNWRAPLVTAVRLPLGNAEI